MKTHPAAFFTRFLSAGVIFLALIILSGCQYPFPQHLARILPTAIHVESQGAAPVQMGGEPAVAQPTQPGEAPLRFTLPTPGQVPQSLWRPPLYDTPWALGPNDHFYFDRPIAADEVNWPVADYRYGGMLNGGTSVHTGIDIPAPRDTPVIAAANGKVVWAGFGLYYGNDDENDPYGLAVTIRHDFGFHGERLYTIYAHMDEIKVVTGQEVKTGDLLGLVGTTGNTTGPHVHFEVRNERNSYFTTYNPELWLAPPQGWGVLAGQLLNTNGSFLDGQDVIVKNKDTGQKWTVRTYTNQAVNSDPYYEENMVLSDLPAGKYQVSIEYQEKTYQKDIEIHPGAVSYFKFRGKLYFNTSLPSAPSLDELLGEPTP